jgi:AraC-like DNA-binding protein
MSANWDFPRNISSVVILTEVGARYGLSLDQCLANSGVRPEQMDSPTAEIAAGQELRVIRNLLERIGRDAPLGLEAGLGQRPTTFGVWGLALLSAPFARDAIDVGLRYLRLTSIFCDIKFVEDREEAHLIADDSQLPADLRQFLVERDGATLVSLCRNLLPSQVAWTRLEVRHPRPRYDQQVRELFGVEPRYNQVLNRISTDVHNLERAMPQGFAPTLKLCEMQCRKLLERRRPGHGMAGRIRQRLGDDPRAMPSMSAMATELKIPLRTLRRRLALEGTNYESLIGEVRAALAGKLLVTTKLPVSDIAEHLGYSEPSCFVRAFTRWNAMSPTRYRESMIGLNGHAG